MPRHRAALYLILSAQLGCAKLDDAGELDLPWQDESFPALVDPADNPTTEAKIELGRNLFYDPVLSSDRKVACATCHSEIWGLGDGLPLSVGVGGVGPVGPGRTGPNQTKRNAPTLWNVAYREALFWDGRTPTLEEQALLPLANPVELNRAAEEVVAELRKNKEYLALFAVAFGESASPVSSDNLGKALAAFQRTMISNRSPYDRYVRGDVGALRPLALEGMFLFGEAGCAGCHAPPFFASNRYARRLPSQQDDGRYALTKQDDDRGAFRVPTLRNLRETGPYFHDGSVASLDAAVGIEIDNCVRDLGLRSFTKSEQGAIAEFIRKGLMDRSREPDRPEQVPSGLQVPLDGFRIVR
jgi:cytochrome c peroxidase